MNWTRTVENGVILAWIAAVLWIAQQLGALENGWREFVR